MMVERFLCIACGCFIMLMLRCNFVENVVQL